MTAPTSPRHRTRPPVAALLALGATAAVAAATVCVRTAGPWSLHVSRHLIELSPTARRNCPDCRGQGGWWIGGANPEMEACGCWSDRPTLRVRLLPRPPIPDEPPF
ncbi:hypothetical protein [Streptomyces megasporus]|uniref:hypothetical protein n=1 Tax=Streptomyces megasporus TaxID=44060 RepID=UPI0006925EC1|nr:hypothetical protein [Streptomyces megasporus]